MRPEVFVGGTKVVSKMGGPRLDRLEFAMERPARGIHAGDDLDVRLHVLTPCGDGEVKLRVVGINKEEIPNGMPIEFASADSLRSGTLIVDNRKGKAKRAKLGELSVPLEKGVNKISVPVPECAEGRTVAIDDSVVGAVDETFGALVDESATRCRSTFGAALVDVSGGRCYDRRLLMYASVTLGGGTTNVEAHYAGARVYMLPEPAGLFTKAADSVTGGKLEVLCSTDLQDGPC